MIFLIPIALFVVPAAAFVLSQQAELPLLGIAALGYHSTVVASQGYEPGEGPFSPRYNEAGIDIVDGAKSELGARLHLLARAHEPLRKYTAKKYHLTQSEGQFLSQLVNTAVLSYRQLEAPAKDLRQFIEGLEANPEVITEESVDAIMATKEELAARFEKSKLAFQHSCVPVTVYLKQKECRMTEF